MQPSLDNFYSIIPFALAIDRLQNVRVKGVSITVTPTDTDTVEFRLDLQKKTPVSMTLIMAHLDGTIRQVQDGKIHIAYQTHPLSRNSKVIIPAIGIAMSALLAISLPPEFAPIASAPGVAGALFALFWNMLSSDFRKDDQFRLEELIERILEKSSSMVIWQS
jgi:hypothetical protein